MSKEQIRAVRALMKEMDSERATLERAVQRGYGDVVLRCGDRLVELGRQMRAVIVPDDAAPAAQ